MTKPINRAVIVNEDFKTQREMIEYWVNNKETCEFFLLDAQKTAERLRLNIPEWLPIKINIVRKGPTFDKTNNLVFEYWAEIDKEGNLPNE